MNLKQLGIEFLYVINSNFTAIFDYVMLFKNMLFYEYYLK
jgi:hypothetical protein